TLSASGHIAYQTSLSGIRAYDMVGGGILWSGPSVSNGPTLTAAFEDGTVAAQSWDAGAQQMMTTVDGSGGAVIMTGQPAFQQLGNQSPVDLIDDAIIGISANDPDARLAAVVSSINVGFDLTAGFPLQRGSPERTNARPTPVLEHFVP